MQQNSSNKALVFNISMIDTCAIKEIDSARGQSLQACSNTGMVTKPMACVLSLQVCSSTLILLLPLFPRFTQAHVGG